MKLYEAFYPPNHHLPYSVVVTYQAALPNGTRVNISTVPSCPDRQVWLWASSPALFLLSPTELNRIALYTLNHFTEWVAPHLTIATPLPCSAKAKEFLTLMTTLVSSTYNEFTECSLVCTKFFVVCGSLIFVPHLPSFRHMLWVRCQKENTWDVSAMGVT